jgi:hypothetical protein
MNCYVHEIDGAPRSAAKVCDICHRGICTDCDYAGMCYIDAEASGRHDYTVAKSRLRIVWIFTGIVTFIGTVAAMSSDIGLGYALLLAPVFFIVAWSFYWGWGTFARWMRGKGFSFGFIGGDGGPIAAAIRLAIVLLFLELVAIGIGLIGLFTGVQKFLVERRIVQLWEGGWQKHFPGKYRPAQLPQEELA